MTATCTFDVFSSLDGFGGVSDGSWGGYWGKQGPELLDYRLGSSQNGGGTLLSYSNRILSVHQLGVAQPVRVLSDRVATLLNWAITALFGGRDLVAAVVLVAAGLFAVAGSAG
jgi:hypothetical protein